MTLDEAKRIITNYVELLGTHFPQARRPSGDFLVDGDALEYICSKYQHNLLVKDNPNALSEHPFLTTIKLVESYGGEDMGSEYYYVFQLTNLETDEIGHIMYNGHYSSWNGVEWDDSPFMVEPYEKIVIDYRRT